jgi:serine/threonine protein kinase/Tol biopolymer transport system component
MIGRTLEHFRVGEQLGRGGMGEVYIADDISLDRKVALKFLPDAFAGDPERMARFEREAKLLASLNHPNIAAIYGLQQAEGKRFIVMELVEGETLAQRISKGALPANDALALCRQIAQGLEAAHEKGVIHRDLKPANVMITEGDQVKILDFGLAKALSGETQSADASQSPTITEAMTQPGIVLGTAAYMSPEQAKGRAVDKRADIWAFGCILYECLTGKRAFAGETITETLAAILKSEPDWSALSENTPPTTRAILRRCINKDRKQQLHDIGDARLDIETALEFMASGADASDRKLPSGIHRRREAIAWILFAITAVSGLFIWTTGIWGKKSEGIDAPVYATIPMTDPINTLGVPWGVAWAHIAISPDGHLVALRQNSKIWLRSLDSFSYHPVDGSDRGAFPVFSPDGTWLAFVTPEGIKRVEVGGGPVDVVAREAVSHGIAWGEDGYIYFGRGFGASSIWRVPFTGGAPEKVTEVSGIDVVQTCPQLLPGGKTLLYTAVGPTAGSDDSKVYAQQLGSRERKLIINKAMSGRYLPTGHIIYTNNSGTIYAQPFDLERLVTTGKPVPVLGDVAVGGWGGAAFLAASNSGTMIFIKQGNWQLRVFRAVDMNGHTVESKIVPSPAKLATIGPSSGSEPRVSPRGERMIFENRQAGKIDLWMYDSRIGEPQRFTIDPAEDEYPAWAPDGKAVAYSTTSPGGACNINIKSIDTSIPPTLFRKWSRHLHVTSWSPDGGWLGANDFNSANKSDVLAFPRDGKDPIAVAAGPANELNPQFSPDGKWIAYTSDESGRNEVWLVSFPDLALRRQVSTGGGSVPQWDPNKGQRLYYLQNGSLIAQEISIAGDLILGQSHQLFSTDAYYMQPLPGGQFFLSEPNVQTRDVQIQLVVNWFKELKQRVPTK